MEILVLEHVSFIDPWSAQLALKNIGNDTAQIDWYSVNGVRRDQGRPSPLSIQPGATETLNVSVLKNGYRFEKGQQYEVRMWTIRGYQIIFTITP